MRPDLVRLKFPGCDHEVEVMAGSRIPHSCSACALGIPEGASQCEDYPCCGHTDGDGCMPNPRHTSEYWSERFASMTQEEMDYMDEVGGW